MKKILCLLLFLKCNFLLFSDQRSDFFEKNIRPVLIEHCYECHSSSSEKIKGGLRLDSKEDILKGGNSGNPIVSETPEKSLLFNSISYVGEFEMPPKYKLSDEIIKNFEIWMRDGGWYPDVKLKQQEKRFTTDHWAYTPIKKPSVPSLTNSFIENEIDSFVLKLQIENNLSPSKIADKNTLIRRVYYTLTGLPPTYENVLAFQNDTTENSYSNMVESVLNSKQYGERWGRIWLDTARYSDTTGIINNNRESRFTYSHTYRDYVIDAFNSDLPFNRFILEQIAADLIPSVDKKSLAALGFLSIGKDSANIHDVIDDRIDVVTKGFMASTVVCARCHDHKFDPISTKDYYSLHGIFSNIEIPPDSEKPIISKIDEEDYNYKNYLKEKNKIENEINEFINNKFKSALADFKSNTSEWLYGAYVLNTMEDEKKQDYAREHKLNPRILQNWTTAIKSTINIQRRSVNSEKSKASTVTNSTFYLYAQMFSVKEKDFANSFKSVSTNKINPYLYTFLPKKVTNMVQVTDAYEKAIIFSEKTTTTNMIGISEFRESIFGKNGPLGMNRDNFHRFYENNQLTMRYENDLRRERGKLISLELSHPGTPHRAMIVKDKENLTKPYVFIKGDPRSRGVYVDKKFLEFLNINPNIYTNGSGRLDLAYDIINPKNPLTARVIVNRIWQGHFESGFVKTPDDFGVQTEKPIHSELFDYLSNYLVENNWSIKQLHRFILNSNTYKQEFDNNPKKSSIDPENKFLWRFNLLRLDFEGLRDSLVYFTGNMIETNGPSVDLFLKNKNDYPLVRSVYGYIDRNRLPEVFVNFDFATPEMTTGKRFKTTIPKQSLFLLNNEFVSYVCGVIVKRNDFVSILNDEDKIKKLYELFFQRHPTENELLISKEYLNSVNSDIKWNLYVHMLLMSNELIYIR